MTGKYLILSAAAGLLFTAGGIAGQVRQEQDVLEMRLPAPGHRVLSPTVEFMSGEFGVGGKLVKGAPYAADAVTETVQVLGDGNRISRKNTASIARDSEGRTRRDISMSAVGPWATAGSDATQLSFIHDPVAGVSYTLEHKTKTARKMPGYGMAFEVTQSEGGVKRVGAVHTEVRRRGVPASAAGGDVLMAPGGSQIMMRVPDSSQNQKAESLGKRTIEGVIAEGTRTVTVIPAGEIGNERPIEIVNERWYSPELQTLVMTKHSDPRMGETVYKLTNVRPGEPAKILFEVPADYTVTEAEVLRRVAPPKP